MNKTISINISGIIFNIDEEAYLRLRQYLETISGYFSDSDGGKEIMEDIESRIAELLQERTNNGTQVVSGLQVDEVIAIMGQPEDYLDEDQAQQSSSKSSRKKRTGKKLFRDPDKKVMGGVLSGISAFFGWNPVWLRVFFFIVAVTPFLINQATAIILYLILWVVIPLARTTSEKIEMRGEPVNVDSIKKKVDETFEEVTGGAKLDSGFQLKRAREGVSSFFDVLISFLQSVFKVIGKVVGFVLILFGFLGLVTVITGFIDPLAIGPEVLPYGLDEYSAGLFDSSALAGMFAFGLATQVLIPLLLILLLGLVLLFNTKFNRKTVFVSLGITWIVGLAMLLVSSISTGKEFNNSSSTYDTEILQVQSDTLFVSIRADEYFGDDKRYAYGDDQEELLKLEGDRIVFGYPHVELVPNKQTNTFDLRLEKESRGRGSDSALEKAINITYNSELTDDELVLDPYYSVPLSDKFRGQKLFVQLQIPVGKTVYLGENLPRIMRTPSNKERLSGSQLAGNFWTMTESGLQRTKQ